MPERRRAGGWMSVRPTQPSVPSSWPVTFISSFAARSKEFPKKMALSPPTRSPSRTGWWRCSSNMARWPTTGLQMLRACFWKLSSAVSWASTPSPVPRPTLSLRRTGLLVNGRRDVQIASEIAREIPSADRIDLLCAFVRHSGLRLFRSELEERVREGAQVRVIASVYTGSTERRALDALVDLGAQVKVSYEVARTRLHAKAWLFHRHSGLHTAYIGSSNLTHTAQIEGLEWNVRVSAAENPEVIERFEATFEQYWQEPEFEDYARGRDTERLDHALSRQRGGGSSEDITALSLLVDVSPKPHQAVALEALEAERLRGHHRNLVVAATGTGKTWIAAFDFKRLRDQGVGRSLLFVAHRDEILRQSQQVFQLVLREPGFGERLVGGERPPRVGYLRLDRPRQQGPGAAAQHLGQRIGKRRWLAKLQNGIVTHGVSLLRWRSGGSITPTIRRHNPSPRHQLLAIAQSLPPSTAPIATGWSDSCRAGFAPARRQHLSTAHE